MLALGEILEALATALVAQRVFAAAFTAGAAVVDRARKIGAHALAVFGFFGTQAFAVVTFATDASRVAVAAVIDADVGIDAGAGAIFERFIADTAARLATRVLGTGDVAVAAALVVLFD